MDRSRIPRTGKLSLDFSATTQEGEPFSLHKTLKESGNLALFLYRGHW